MTQMTTLARPYRETGEYDDWESVFDGGYLDPGLRAHYAQYPAHAPTADPKPVQSDRRVPVRGAVVAALRARRAPASAREVARATGRSRSAVTIWLLRLEADGLVVSCAGRYQWRRNV